MVSTYSICLVALVSILSFTSATNSVALPNTTTETDHHHLTKTVHHRYSHGKLRAPSRRIQRAEMEERSERAILEKRLDLLGLGSLGNVDTLLVQLDLLNLNLLKSSKALRSSRKSLQSNPSLAKKAAYQKKVYEELKSYRDATSDFPVLSSALQKTHSSSLLSGLGADMGQENLDKYNRAEVAISNIARSTKWALEDTDLIFFQIPLLGQTVAPLVYDLKCVLEDVIDTTTNVVDGILNGSTLLSSLSMKAGALVCKMKSQLCGDL